MKLKHMLASLALALAAACAQNDAAPEMAAPSETALVAEGRHIAEIYCATCHAIGAEGESRHALAPPFRTFSRDYPVTALEEAFAEGILVGHPDMPEFAFEPAQIDALLAYLQSIQASQGG